MLEVDHQKELVKYFKKVGWKYTAIINDAYYGGNTKQRMIAIRKTRSMGFIPGLPDMLVILPTGRLVFVELKLPIPILKNGSLSSDKKFYPKPEQAEWISSLNMCEGVTAIVGNGYKDAIKKLEEMI